MADVLADIREWLLNQQDWLQETAAILLERGTLSEAERAALVIRLKSEEGRQITKHRPFGALLNGATAEGELRLSSIGEVVGIENLAPREPLTFGTGNLTVIYGHNGSGKSSYTRILKKAAGKPRAAILKPNVFQFPPNESKCTIAFTIGGAPNSVVWPADGAPIDPIGAVDIFDSDEATHYLNGESAASYTPPIVALFEKLAIACDQLKSLLQAEEDLLVSALPLLPANYAATEPGQRYGGLKPTLKEEAIKQLLQWTPNDIRALEQLDERLKADDPSALARRKRSTKVQLDQLITKLRDALKSFGLEGIESLRRLQANAIDKQQIANEAAQINTSKIEGVGAATWRALWEAARVFSQTAYPSREFPVIDDARCLLCHQELKPEAQHRLQEFESFVQGKLETAAKLAKSAYEDERNALPQSLSLEQLKTTCEAAALTEDRWLPELTAFWTKVTEVRACLITGEVDGHAHPVQANADLLDTLTARAACLEQEAVQHDEDALNIDRGQITNSKLALEAQRWISEQEAAVRTELLRLKQVKEYETWKKLPNSRPVSLKASEVAEQVITQAYVARFNRELQLLGANRIKIELVKTKTTRGKSLYRLQLKGALNEKAVPENVLSEGERRIISLAAFLADVSEKPQASPFIFDDPISSLDHDFEWSVAKRLVDLAKQRQVLVFTHRLSLYGAMEDVAKKASDEWRKQHFSQLCIESYSGVSGHPAHQATWNAKTEKANNILITRLTEAKKAGDQHGAEAYKNLAQGICSDFRKLLERTVEDDLLNEVVKRHRRSVTTDNRLGVLPHITVVDCQFIDGLMTKYSCYEHSQSQENPIFIPEEAELRVDLESLKQWRESFRARPKQAVA